MASNPLSCQRTAVQAVAAPLGALLLKFLPARHLEAMVSVLMVLIMGVMNRSTLRAWAAAALAWLGPSQAAYTGYHSLDGPRRQQKGKGARLPRGSALDSSGMLLSG